jgi:hypothetical protein
MLGIQAGTSDATQLRGRSTMMDSHPSSGCGSARLPACSNVASALDVSAAARSVPKFSLYPGLATDVAVGANGSVWAVSANPVSGGYRLWRWTGTAWAPVRGGGIRIAVDPSGNPWMVNSLHHIYRWAGTGWTRMPGAATDLGIGANGSVWAVSANPVSGGYRIWRWTGTGWAPVSVGGLAIAVDPVGYPWVVNSGNQILSYRPVGQPSLLTSVSANGRYVEDQYGNPFLINGDSAWNLAFALDATDQATYLADRAANGFNAVITDLVGDSTNGGNANGANYAGEVPFTGGDFSTPNQAYWSKIDTFLRLCQHYGISVLAIPVDAYATGSGQVFANMSNAQASALGTFLAGRYPQSQYPGIVWMLGNDYAGDGAGGGNLGFVSQYQALLSAFATAGSTRPTTIEQGYDESLSTDGTTLGPLVTLNGGYSYHPTYEVILNGWAAKDIPVFFFEGAYENAVTGFPSSGLDLRKQLGWSMTSGATGTFYGNDYLWKFQSGWQTELDTNDVAQRKAFNDAFAGIKWWTLQPDNQNQVVTEGRNTEGTDFGAFPNTPFTNDPTYGNYVTAAYSPDGSLAVMYNPDTSLNSITVSGAALGANPTITAVDPTDGARTSLGWTATPTLGANAAGDHDWLFIISASSRT